MSQRDHLFTLLGKTLNELSPLIETAMRALDRPGSRALRYKIDRDFHFAVGAYNMIQRTKVPECDWPQLDGPVYDRVIPLRVEGQKQRRPKPRPRGPALRLVVDNSGEGAPHGVAQGQGDAA